MDTLAPPVTLVFRRRSTLDRLVLDAGLEIGAGGEAVVYELPGNVGLVAKVYHAPTIDRARKLTLMLANPPRMPAGTSIAWPTDLLLDASGFAGFLMPRAEGPRLFEFYNPVTRRATAPAFHFGMMHRAGRNLAAAFDALHAAGYVVGDVNESNLLVSPADASVTLVDADSMQVRDGDAGTTFRSRVGKAEFTPPELQGLSFDDVDRAPEHDRFGLGVLLFLLLMEGTHPFATRMAPGVDALPVEERIRLGHFPHAREDDACHPPRMSPPFDTLHPGLRALFVRCFVSGHGDPAARPSPAEWQAALEEAEAELAQCADNAQHRHAPHLAACPWCERAAQLGGRDPFPAGAVHAPTEARPRPRARRVRVPDAFAAAPPANPTTAGLKFGVQPPFQPMNLSRLPSVAAPPVVFGPSGARNPLVFALGGLTAMAAGHGAIPALGFIMAFVAAWMLARGEWRQIRAVTVFVALFTSLCVAAVVGMGGPGADDDDAGSRGSVLRDLATEPFVAAGPAVAVDPPPAGDAGIAAGADAPPQGVAAADGRSMMDVLVADLYSAPVTEASFDPGPVPKGGRKHDAGVLAAGDEVDRLPLLDNAPEAAQALAVFYRNEKPRPAAGRDTAMLWLHVGADGRVTPEGHQLVRSTTGAAARAAEATVPYLRFRPATRDGQPVGVWVTQRLVIVP
jgi:hypothetical protein